MKRLNISSEIVEKLKRKCPPKTSESVNSDVQLDTEEDNLEYGVYNRWTQLTVGDLKECQKSHQIFVRIFSCENYLNVMQSGDLQRWSVFGTRVQ